MPFGIDSDDMRFNISLGNVQPDYVRSNTARHIEILTQAEYDALETPDENTLYVIVKTSGT